MMKRSWAKLAVTVGGLALASTAGAGVASAEPDIGPMVNTTCSYDQAMRAVHAENPMAAQYLDQSPPNQQFLQQFMAAPRDKRVDMLKAIQHNPGIDQAYPIFKQMMTDCVNY
ncbi:hemophore-related protein [Mycobacterium intracellulare]|uniref:hemophore-related protein n=1 Tax=Mycobacterium intracellulare TaxID=1767 RepID=UPI000BB08717|nr:hemophore-related protein [Mycobacterium intracellulare]PBA30767.1 hemophore-related protein [Mycobacterium intracellulare]